MRKALVVGINYYAHVTGLHGCSNDAHRMCSVLERNADGTVNFSVKLLTGTKPEDAVSRSDLRNQIRELFEGDNDIALFYFAGHGHIETTGGYILACDSRTGDEGVPLADVLTFANNSPARNKIIVLDSCHSGIAGASSIAPSSSELKEGITILTALDTEQYATESNGAGVFTTLFVDAMEGAACNLVGDITPGGVYAHIDQSLGPWDQRPVFKTNVKSFVLLRKVQPPIALVDLRRITELFPRSGYQFPLNPTFEPELIGRSQGMPNPDPTNTAKFAILQKLNRVNLVVPVDAPHMWHAAMESKSCRLTVLGEHYRRLVELNRI